MSDYHTNDVELGIVNKLELNKFSEYNDELLLINIGINILLHQYLTKSDCKSLTIIQEKATPSNTNTFYVRL